MDKEFIESFLAGEFRNGEIKRFNAQGTWSSFQKAYLLNLVLWNFTDAFLVDDTAFCFQVNTEKYNPGWVVITTNTEGLFKIYFVIEAMLLESIDDVYITDLAKEIDGTL
ncbi:MAG: hypothetical protein ACI85O_002518 [Saprospiraceae bacterium]|jgi:hypothetical protein